MRLASAIEPFEPALRVDEVLNVVGWVRARPGGPEVVVRSSADVRRTAVAETPVAVSPGEATSLTSGQLPDVATAMRAGDASDRSSGLPLGLLLPLACALAGLAVLLVGGAVVSMAWPSLGGRGQSTGRVPPAQPDDRDPTAPRTACGSALSDNECMPRLRVSVPIGTGRSPGSERRLPGQERSVLARE